MEEPKDQNKKSEKINTQMAVAVETPVVQQHREAHEAAEAAVYGAAVRAGLGGNKRKAGVVGEEEKEAVAGLVALARETEDVDA